MVWRARRQIGEGQGKPARRNRRGKFFSLVTGAAFPLVPGPPLTSGIHLIGRPRRNALRSAFPSFGLPEPGKGFKPFHEFEPVGDGEQGGGAIAEFEALAWSARLGELLPLLGE